MEPSYPFETLAIDSIRQDKWSLHQDIDVAPSPALIDSIKQFGLFRPPVVRKTESGFELICGHMRIELLKRYFNSGSLVCKVVPAISSIPEILRIVIEDQLLSGSLTPIMTARLLVMCNTKLPKRDVDAFIDDAGINPARSRHLQPLLGLEPEIRNAVHLGVLSEKTALEFLTLELEDRLFLLDLFTRLNLNANKQKRLIEFCRIITGTTLQPIKKIFTDKLQYVMKSEELLNVPQVSATLIKDLYQLSHPFSSRAENEFNQRSKAMKLPQNFSVHHSPSFEKDEITLEIKLENLDKLEKRLNKFKELFS